MSRKLYHGAAYYPELWNEGVIEEDIQQMKEVGINVVRMGEFAWSNTEPEKDKFDIEFFTSIINRLYEHGIETVMCTPTPTPPRWFSYGHPERMYVDHEGKVMDHGSRQHACTNHPYFRERAALVTENLARAVGSLPGVIGWQIDNEFKCHVSECMCHTCKEQWHDWLKNRYETIENLNEAWGTKIWSEYYHSFEEVPQPGPAPFLHNSSLSTMYQLFSMEKIAEFSDEQAEIIRGYSKAPITHNSSIAFSVDNERLFKHLDFASFDTYAAYDNFPAYLINSDLWRNFKKGKGFWVMETSPSYAASLESHGTPHPNGYLKVEAAAAYALGAEGFCYWLWRQQRAGCEQPHGSVLSAWGKPTVGYQNVLEVEQLRKDIEPVILATTPSQAQLAITYSDRSKAFLKTEPHRNLSHRSLVTDFYERILTMGIHRDLIPEEASLDGYKVLMTPFIHYLSSEYIKRAEQFVKEGGTWIVGPLTGGRTEEHTVHTDFALGELERISGADVLFTYPMDDTGSIGRAFDVSAPLGMWSSVFEHNQDTVVGTIEEGLSAGKAFITEHALGAGKIVMLGSLPLGDAGDQLIQRLVDHYCVGANVSLRTDVTKGTIVAPRQGDGYSIWFVINMDGNGGSVTLPKEGLDMQTNTKVNPGTLKLEKFEYRVIQFNEK
ncbi:beta-galactosidase [Bacillus suaedae]|uniref:Beta-galactosidase n=1 Tax=Halalkalibacter suaedae TaxID=2822140 RepID=A0A940WV62_9BACI|nr:beta-galactosidase [Bacillus suaedae]MBP3953359.1 beta-galactosidase [Bacillus suaedae]